MNNSHKTAITRNRVSAPTAFLTEHGYLKSNTKILDYGCGKGFDADTFNFTKYDPHFFPKRPAGKFDVIICNYVLNVIDEEEANQVIKDIKSMLNGVAYLTVRRDITKEGVTSKGTFQRNVILNLPIVKETKAFCIYKLIHTDTLEDGCIIPF